MYSFVLTLHSLLRWVVVILAVVTVARAFRGWFGKKEWMALDGRLGMLSSISIDLQLLMGLILYIFLSPSTKSAFQDFGATMSDQGLRYWAVEHVFWMVLALILMHVGRAISKRAVGATSKHRRAAIFFGLATLAILFAIPWPFLSYGRPLIRLVALVWP
jgi:hypothetical protein